MNLLARRLIKARTVGEIINYYIESNRLEFLTPARKFNDNDVFERVNGVSIETMRHAVRQAGIDVAPHVLTIWS